jgi:carbon storage regulator
MLVLTRRTRQSIMIGDEIELSVLSVSGEKVRLGIEAPEHVPLFRKEVYLRIKEERGDNVADDGRVHATSSVERELEKLAAPRGAR